MKEFLESKDLLQTVISETESISREAQELVKGLDEEQLNWKPDASQWSIAQCLDHLAVTAKAWEPILSEATIRGRKKWATSQSPAYKPTLVGGWLIKQIAPENTRKFPAPKVFRPGSSSNIQDALERFLGEQNRFRDFVIQARGLDYNKTRLRSPVTPLMRYSLADSFVVVVLHCRRHLAQARRVMESANFPTVHKAEVHTA